MTGTGPGGKDERTRHGGTYGAAQARREAARGRGNRFACDLAAGRIDLPGGRIHATPGWVVEHCLGPLGVGTLIVKPVRHVVSAAELTDVETFADRVRRAFASSR